MKRPMTVGAKWYQIGTWVIRAWLNKQCNRLKMVDLDYRPSFPVSPSRFESAYHAALSVDTDTQKPVARISFPSLHD